MEDDEERKKKGMNKCFLFFVKYLILTPKLINFLIQSATNTDDSPNERPNTDKTKNVFDPSYAYSKGG